MNNGIRVNPFTREIFGDKVYGVEIGSGVDWSLIRSFFNVCDANEYAWRLGQEMMPRENNIPD